eukprot:TRINITY_DN7884_c0_g1_i1.p1 TRINITY_DN7884_c0_g1~~TRINITY_DN7884_c0_g1_i1.p1  ORF type:complete len:311 (+),score=61.69 TRINITY_DN7884_c0_g1_i1:1-933(+)
MNIFGGESGEDQGFKQHSDLWRLDLETLEWQPKEAPNGPSKRSGHRMVTTGVYLIVFGGYTESKSGKMTYHNDLHIFDMIEDRWLELNGSGAQPAPRSGFLFWASLDGRSCCCAGGTGANKAAGWLRDVWVLDLPSMSWSCVVENSPEEPRIGTTLLANCPDHVLVFGGMTETLVPVPGKKKPRAVSSFHSDVRALTAEGWRSGPPQAAGPTGRMHGAGVVLQGWAVLYGGLCEAGRDGMTSITLDDMWATRLGDTSATWVQLLALSPKVGEWFGSDSDGDGGSDGGESDDSDDEDDGAQGEGELMDDDE